MIKRLKTSFVFLLVISSVGSISGCLAENDGGNNSVLDSGLDRDTSSSNIVSVIEVVDGDTIKIYYNNNSIDTVRLIGVDTPEVYSENASSEFEEINNASYLKEWGCRASNYTKSLLENEEITLGFDYLSDRRG
ncbi:MAG: Endonuclease YncB, thermonuclease family [Candidatus Methanohalarchaeum thermophilum]|uniref:Endonuclease YncB, thermonuclease family n=1 Tax=Methanohalarchaeum thermophilum TaxID=1903181 RepID=A0A1Q6DV88_METT1|nr:MAG: Endonuclease YncB, thermonuclease family [Candidatus Methanohalarchaeum thermophilum]